VTIVAAPIVSALAVQDLEGIERDIAAHSQRAADRWMAAFEERFALLAMFPHLGTPRADVSPDLRFSVLHPYVIYYRPSAPAIEIVRVVHGQRDVGGILPP